MEWSLALVALALLGVAAISHRLSATPVTPAMLFVAFGLLVGPKVLDGIDLSSTGSTVRVLAEATLALVLFTDASRIDLGQLRRTVGVPLRLLAIGLPLTLLLGAVAAAAVFGQLSVEEAVILAVVLAPTDAALGQAVVTEPRVPKRIRQGLNVESGLNDGICVPLLFAAVAAADVESEISGGRSATTLLVEEIGYGVLGGVAAGLLIAGIVAQAGRRDLIAPAWRQVIPAAGAALAYGIASALGGSGFIAAFVAGVVFRLALRRDPEELNELTEEVGAVLNGATLVLFGALLLGPALTELSWQLALYSVLSLTLVRMIPVAVAMRGSRTPPDRRLPGLVRPPRARVHRVRRDRHRRVAPSARAPHRPRHLPHRRPLGPRPRPHRRPARRPLRPLVRAPPPRAAAADGGRPGRGHPTARASRAPHVARAVAVYSSGAPNRRHPSEERPELPRDAHVRSRAQPELAHRRDHARWVLRLDRDRARRPVVGAEVRELGHAAADRAVPSRLVDGDDAYRPARSRHQVGEVVRVAVKRRRHAQRSEHRSGVGRRDRHR
jgi:sodium/hydrogen antiporter